MHWLLCPHTEPADPIGQGYRYITTLSNSGSFQSHLQILITQSAAANVESCSWITTAGAASLGFGSIKQVAARVYVGYTEAQSSTQWGF